MGTADFAAFVRRAMFLDRPDPVAAWARAARAAGAAGRAPGAASELRIEAEGTDLRSPRRRAHLDQLRRARNMPSGEVFTGPVEDSAEGRIRFAVPSSPRGVEVAGVELELREGGVVDARAERGEEYLQATLDTDAGARRLGEIGIGTNAGIDRAGRGDPVRRENRRHRPPGARPLVSGDGRHERVRVHWDLICDLRRGGRLSADGEPLMEGGRFA